MGGLYAPIFHIFSWNLAYMEAKNDFIDFFVVTKRATVVKDCKYWKDLVPNNRKHFTSIRRSNFDHSHLGGGNYLVKSNKNLEVVSTWLGRTEVCMHRFFYKHIWLIRILLDICIYQQFNKPLSLNSCIHVPTEIKTFIKVIFICFVPHALFVGILVAIC